ncbi:MAG: PLP-dependent aminotransferase family protein [Bordetella sp.]|uniref:MocR-like pyridoxine biosynthesis transcription factor PdxR n=1 Tax=Bordetella sp. TaxID=28081 RepID=UPI003F7B720E
MDIRTLKPQRRSTTPIYLQLYLRFRDAIADGRLSAGDRVPAVRSLASELNLARGTVESAYQILISEGYLVARGPAGTVVSPQLDGRHGLDATRMPASTPRPAGVAKAAPRPFQLGLPALDAFPRKTWVRLAGRRLRGMGDADMDYQAPGGYLPLRRAIAAYLGVSRGIACAPEQVFVTTGYLDSLNLIRHTVLSAGDKGWFEDPGYPYARRFLEQAGMRLVYMPVDDEGLRVQAGRRASTNVRFAVVTPTHQSPLGVALSLPRRLALLEWARENRSWIVEDDYDSEFRYHGRPLPPLKSLDRYGSVLYAGTFSKVLYPGLRLAYLVVPDDCVPKFEATASLLRMDSPALQQATVADFMEQGHFSRHLKKMRALYGERRGYLVAALKQALGDALQIPDRAGGLHVLGYWKGEQSDRAAAQAAHAQGLAIHALSTWKMKGQADQGLLLGFANLGSAEAARGAVRRLLQAMKSV